MLKRRNVTRRWLHPHDNRFWVYDHWDTKGRWTTWLVERKP